MRQTIVVEEMRSGEDEDTLWVSLGFKSELSEYDVLFIVCGKEIDEQDRELGLDGLYFERLDQINSCYNAAESLRVSEQCLDVDFDEEGARDLKLPTSVRFDWRSVASEARAAHEVFRKMAKYDWAGAIKSA